MSGAELILSLSLLWYIDNCVVTGVMLGSDGLLNSALYRLVWCFCLHSLHCNFDGHCEALWCPKQLKQCFPLFTDSRRCWGFSSCQTHQQLQLAQKKDTLQKLNGQITSTIQTLEDLQAEILEAEEIQDTII